MCLSTRVTTVPTNSVEFARLAGKFGSLYAYCVFAGGSFGVTVCIVRFGVCRNGATELAIDVEVRCFRGIVKEPNESFRCALPCRRGPIDQPDGEQQAQSHSNQLPAEDRRSASINNGVTIEKLT
jgi:hypothetical protein